MFILKRFLLGVVTLLMVAVALFFLLRAMPGDEVESYSGIESKSSSWSEKKAYKEHYLTIAKNLQLDFPLFYFSISKYDFHFSKNYIFPFEKNAAREALTKGYDEKTCNSFVDYENAYDSYLFHLKWMKSDSLAAMGSLAFFQNDFDEKSKNLQTSISDSAFLAEDKKNLSNFSKSEFNIIRSSLPESSKKYFSWFPYFRWNGSACQFHHWLSRLCMGDFGNSYTTHRAVSLEIQDAIKWTFFLNLSALALLFSLAIPLGLRSAQQKNKRFDRIMLRLSNYLDAIPAFWLATIVLIFFTTSYYHLKIFPSSGLGDFFYDAPFFKKLLVAIPHFIAPVFCIVLSSFPFFFRQMRSSALSIFQEDFVKTAQSKGLDGKTILRKHVFPNAIFPMITLLGAALPSVILGSVFIENIFNIPGMGKRLLQSIYEQDFPLTVAIVLLIAIFTILGSLLSDILYRFFDPRLRKK
jgi:peptide/nickel transport system permease protein